MQIGDAELTEYLVRQAQRYQMPPQEFANQVVQGGNLPMLVADIRRNKALAGVLEAAAVVTDASGNVTVDLQALISDEMAEPETVRAGRDRGRRGRPTATDATEATDREHRRRRLSATARGRARTASSRPERTRALNRECSALPLR